jgi:hypothetical protein
MALNQRLKDLNTTALSVELHPVVMHIEETHCYYI